MQIATLVPSATDLVAALGFAESIVGVSHECDHPTSSGLPVVTRSRVAAAGKGDGVDPREVDEAVNASIAAGESLYIADRELLAELAPDVVVGQEVCDVCAVSGPVARAALPHGASLVTLTATSLAGLREDITRLAEALNVAERGAELVADVDAGLDEVRRTVTGLDRPRVLTLEWMDPAFLGGHWVPELVELAGGTHLLSGPGDASRRETWDVIAAADPDILVLLPCGYDLPATLDEADSVLSRPEIAALRCVQAGDVWATDANRLFSRCTTNVVEAARTLAAMLHPDAVEPPPVELAVRLTADRAAA